MKKYVKGMHSWKNLSGLTISMQGYLLRFGEIPRRKGERIVLCRKSRLIMIYEILAVL